MIGPLGRLGAAATLGQHCPQMTQRRCTTVHLATAQARMHVHGMADDCDRESEREPGMKSEGKVREAEKGERLK